MAYRNFNNDILPPPKQSAKIQAAECDSCMYIEMAYIISIVDVKLGRPICFTGPRKVIFASSNITFLSPVKLHIGRPNINYLLYYAFLGVYWMVKTQAALWLAQAYCHPIYSPRTIQYNFCHPIHYIICWSHDLNTGFWLAVKFPCIILYQ